MKNRFLDGRPLIYESGYWGDVFHSPGMYQENHTKTDVTLTYHSADGNWTLGLWAKNLEDQAVQAASAPGSLSGVDIDPGAPFLEAPRTFGVHFTVSLGD
jgi:iron complex outermembrane receptor protein